MASIVTLGELLAEFVAARLGQSFSETGNFFGPYPSGAPAIFADQASRMGCEVAYIGCVGADSFGDLIVNRLAHYGVDVRGIRRIAERPTATAFVAYRPDGHREFFFNLANSASSQLTAEVVDPALFEGCRYLHVMGSSLNSEGAIAAVRRAMAEARRHGAQISFDPNIRPEMLSFVPMRAALDEVLDVCDLFLPSEADLPHFCGDVSEAAALDLLWQRPRLSAVVLKRAAAGCTWFDRGQRLDVSSFTVEEVDPTGAGDCFGGTLVAALAASLPIHEALLRANAAGALAVTRRGPMEGNSTPMQLDAFLAQQDLVTER